MPLVIAHERQVQLKIEGPLVSVQGRKNRRDKIVAEIGELTKAVPILFSGDVSVTIELWLSEQERYETDRAADIDNVLKPILDGLCGPDGVIIDDNQVQNIQCYWIGLGTQPTAVISADTHFEDEHVRKEGLVFVHMGSQLYFPMNMNFPKAAVAAFFKMLEKYRETRTELEAQGIPYDDLRKMMPIQRYFHRTRIGRFRMMEFDEAQAALALIPTGAGEQSRAVDSRVAQKGTFGAIK